MPNMSPPAEASSCCLGRRDALAIGIAIVATGNARAQTSPEKMRRPQKGDRLVYASGADAGNPIKADQVELGKPPLMAWAVDPSSGAIRDGSRLNQVLLLRLPPDGLAQPTRQRSADGIVAYSAICTHAQCPVTEWRADLERLHCPCHNSEFDPADGCRVVNGPATRSLAALPITADNEGLTVADTFIGRIGMPAA